VCGDTTEKPAIPSLPPEQLEELRLAKQLLERPSLAAQLTDALGEPIERAMKLLPGKWSERVDTAIRVSLDRALEMAIRSLGRGGPQPARSWFHRAAVAATGAGGGAFGLPGLLVELPVSTTLMLRSIADIARSEGERIDLMESRLACLEVFALGGRSDSDDAVEAGYFAVRSALAGTVSHAVRHLARHGVSDTAAPALVRLIAAIGSRFGVVVSQKAAAMAVPAIGAVGGAVINSIFIAHFQDMARGHFIVRRLERIHGEEKIREVYNELPA
jgi:hypothetical protein